MLNLNMYKLKEAMAMPASLTPLGKVLVVLIKTSKITQITISHAACVDDSLPDAVQQSTPEVPQVDPPGQSRTVLSPKGAHYTYKAIQLQLHAAPKHGRAPLLVVQLSG